MSSVTSTLPTSRRGYLSQDELKQVANIVINDSTEADDVIGQAEELIDAFVGPQDTWLPYEVTGLLSSSGSTTSHTLKTSHQNVYHTDYFKGCEMEIVGGTGAGQRKRITESTKAGVLTTDAFTVALDNTSFYRITQVGKFPRRKDVHFDSGSSDKYYKTIPEQVRRAVAFQVEYIIEMGDSFFKTDKNEYQSESIGDYSYSKGQSGAGINTMIAPKARKVLSGIVNRKGVIHV
jgi:hypothetical protein